MHITTVDTFRVSQRFCLVRVGTDGGHVGWGEATLESRSATVETAVAELSEILIGQDPRAIEKLWQRLRKGGFYRGGPVLGSAVAGIDQALWDIKGKALGAPVHELLGGPARDRVRVYTTVHSGESATMAGDVALLLAAGYTALKTGPSMTLGYLDTPAVYQKLLQEWRDLRQLVGPEIDLAFDFHGRVSLPASRLLLEGMRDIAPFFVEETQPPELQRDIGRICESTSIPIATGERLYDRWEVSDVIDQGIAVIQPDLSHAYGISEVMRIAALADLHGVHLAPHCATGPVSFAACLQVDLAINNFLIQECHLRLHDPDSHPWWRFVNGAPFLFEDGYVVAPSAPGLGVDINEDAVREAALDPSRDNSPILALPDGSYAEW